MDSLGTTGDEQPTKPKSSCKFCGYAPLVWREVQAEVKRPFEFHQLEEKDRYNNPIWHIHNRNPPKVKSEITFNSLLNLVSVCNTTEKEVIWRFINEYDSSLNIDSNPKFDLFIHRQEEMKMKGGLVSS